MKLRIGLITILFNCLLFSFSQDFWEQLYFPDSTQITCIETNDLGHIFVGVMNEGNPGGLYRSIDNALTWNLVLDAGNFTVQSITINEVGKIYCGKTGFDRFLVSEDNGETWETIELPPPSFGNIMKILCVGQDTIYVSSWESEGAFITKSFDAGETWEHSFVTDHQNEYVSDIAISNTGDLFVSVSGFFVDQGGVYKSVDGGTMWEYAGLLNHQVLTIEINSNNDVFTGDWWMMNSDAPGVYALYGGSMGFELVFDAYSVTDIVITEENIIYATANEGVVRSSDNGQTWEIIEDELSSNIKFLNISYDGYLYGASSHRLVKSINSIIIGIDTNRQSDLSRDICAYPNPVNDILNVNIPTGIENSKTGEIRICNLFGELVYRSDLSTLKVGESYQLIINNLSRGIYLLECCVDDKKYTSKLIKK